MKSKRNNNKDFPSMVRRSLRLFGGSCIILCSIFLFLFTSGVWKRDSIVAKNLVELLFKELFVPHKSPFLFLFPALIVAVKYFKPEIQIRRLLKLSLIAAILVTLLFQFKNIGRWFVMRNIVSGFKIIRYDRNPGQPFDVSPMSDIWIENNGMKALALEALINARIDERKELIRTFGYSERSTVKIWIEKKVPQRGYISPYDHGYDYDALQGTEYIYVRME